MLGSKLVILVIMDRFLKFGHFIPLTHPYIAPMLVQPSKHTSPTLKDVPRDHNQFLDKENELQDKH